MDTRIFLEDCFKSMAEKSASDLHIKSNASPRIRVSGKMMKSDKEVLSTEAVRELALSLMSEHQKKMFQTNRGVDFAFTSEKYGRYRANVFYQRGSISMVIRVIRSIIPPFADLFIPKIFENISLQERGLILISGATSSGKSTTVASMVDYINDNRDSHIITIEDPIEYVHEDKRCIVNQREIGQDCSTFYEALKYVVRQDPDIIVVGEMRDSESFRSAVVASETGHLVISTIHAKNVLQVLDRILGFFPSEQHEQILVQLSFNLQAITCQRLLLKKDRSGLIPAFEILRNNATVAQLIRDRKLDKLPQAIVNCTEEGMQTFNLALCSLFNEGHVSQEEAMIASDNPDALEMNLKGIFLDDSAGGIIDR